MRTYYRNRLPGSKSPLIALLLSTSNAYGRAIFKGVLIEHLGVDGRRVETLVFPNSREAQPVRGLIA